MHALAATFSLALAFAGAASVPAQTPRPTEAAATSDQNTRLEAAHGEWQALWRAYLAASKEARESGALTKGGVPPPAVRDAEAAARAASDAILREFGARDDLSTASWTLLARMQESNRDYAGAVRCYERALQAGDPERPDLRTLRSVCIAAMNQKDDAVAAKWMRTTIAAEDRAGELRDTTVRASYFPRALIALGDWDGLERHVETLAAHEDPACATAAVTFGIVAKLHRGDVEGAERIVAAMLADPQKYPDHQAWATMAKLALCVHRGEFAAGAKAVEDYLAVPVGERSQRDKTYHRYLAAVAPFLGRPAPALRSDHCVGGELLGGDVLSGLRGKTVVLDFWQPWCEPCRKAMPEMVAAQRDHDGDVQVLGVCKVEDWGYDVSEKKAVRPLAKEDYPAHVEDFRADMQLNYPLLICDTDANSRTYRIAGVPTLVIVDRYGIVRYMSCGAGEPGLFRLALAGVHGAR